MIGWVFIAVAKSDRVLRGQFMTTIELVIRAVRSIAVTASHCRACKHQRKCGYTNQSKVHHNTPLFIGERRVRVFVTNDTSLRSNANMLISCETDIEMHFANTTKFDVGKVAILQAGVVGEPIG
jgi:hypothetical protein